MNSGVEHSVFTIIRTGAVGPKFPFLKQLDEMDCGPSCLRMIAKHYGKNYSLQKLREKCSISREGVSMLAISDAAEAIGFRTLGVQVTMKKLLHETPLPCIAHWNRNHFVIVYKANERTVRVADPAFGLINYSTDEFARGWLADKDASNATGVLLLLEPSPIFYETEDTGGEKRSSVSFLLSYLRPYRRLFGQLFLGLLLGSLLQLIFPFLTQSVVDVGINTRNLNFIYLVLAGQLMLIFSRATVDFIRRWILLHLSTRINVSIISDFLIKLMKLPIPFFSQKMIGDLLRRIEDHARIEKFLSSSSLNIIFSLFNVIAFGAVLAIYSIPIFLVFFGGSVAYVAFVMLFMKQREALDYKRFDQLSANQTGVIQLIQGIQEIKLNNYDKLKRWEWERGQAGLFRITTASMRLQQYQEAGSLLINELKNVTITFMAAQAVVGGTMTIGMMLASQYIVGQLTAPVNDFINFLREYQDAKISLERINEIHEAKNEEDEVDHVDRVALTTHPGGGLRVESLSFQYDPYSPLVLDNITLQIPQGKVTAIVGASGSGKTTLLKLLLKLYAPSSGSVNLGDFDLKNLRSVEWRKKCGVVMQDGFIFSDSIMRNIALSDEEIDYDKLRNAVRIANIGEFIESLPLKHRTKLGDVGNGLSQGQRQRLLIARAVYKNPEYLFFDEATSALDANNEKSIIKNLDEFFKNKTVVIIAHRLSTVKNADQIIVLDKGKIAETGNHVRLTANRGSYFELVKNQLELGN